MNADQFLAAQAAYTAAVIAADNARQDGDTRAEEAARAEAATQQGAMRAAFAD